MNKLSPIQRKRKPFWLCLLALGLSACSQAEDFPVISKDLNPESPSFGDGLEEPPHLREMPGDNPNEAPLPESKTKNPALEKKTNQESKKKSG